MRDNVTFIVSKPIVALPVGNFGGYIDHEILFAADARLPFPHMRASAEMTQCVLRIEREDHPDVFASNDPLNTKDIDVTSLLKSGAITFNQHLVPDFLKRQ